MARLRVINLGLPKSGTTTLARALRRAGLHVADHRVQPAQTKREDLHQAFVADLLYRGYFQTGDPLAELEEFDGLTEISALRERNSVWPQTDFGLITAIRAAHPGVKFVATRRNVQDISDSMLGWTNLVDRLHNAVVPGLPRGYGQSDSDRVRWIAGHYAQINQLLGGSADFLDLDVSAPDARDRLAAFLGRDMPWWGQANKNHARHTASSDDALEHNEKADEP
jgi:hypothetical protein